LKERQMTCGKAECKRQWHKKQCAKWNKENQDYFRSNYLQNKIDTATSAKPKACRHRDNIRPPLDFIQDVIGVQQTVIIEYMIQLFIRRHHRANGSKPAKNKGSSQQMAAMLSRGDRHVTR
jgi:hypothetical protein